MFLMQFYYKVTLRVLIFNFFYFRFSTRRGDSSSSSGNAANATVSCCTRIGSRSLETPATLSSPKDRLPTRFVVEKEKLWKLFLKFFYYFYSFVKRIHYKIQRKDGNLSFKTLTMIVFK
jgi:hypothetical protein